MRYRKKPVIVDAVRWNSKNYFDVIRLTGRKDIRFFDDGSCIIPTLEGNVVAQKGDYIIKGVRGECYPCKPDIFTETYELVD
ncbi:TPA: hypothetical protein U1W00_001138 [Streptococcus suis]|uniref:hypothetical protein n=1 Tax=Streptococcus TaxID=1301 RepID=UPI00155307B6|nr:hypothetical protein [Streptococcus ruminantium]NQM40347.1 hypothetical protein [Streptococcus suis]NQO45326.1 hypothetical protein [Streptococcus suis]WNF84805.1 hypothetical protein RJW52_02410 [Streptococcus suis]BDD42640.1 prophage protein [Streptococcus ruminantium]HEM4055534.1 hypothetical protein [Streptococcus suis]